MRIKTLLLLFLILGSTALWAVDVARDIVARGSALVGTPYRYGGTTPSGFDCSGLVNYLYKPLVPDLPRTAAAMSRFGKTVSLENIIPGDLVFYATGADSNDITHVGIYIGQDTLIQAVSAGPKRGVVLTDIEEKYWKARYKWAKRVLTPSSPAEQSVKVAYSKGDYSGTVKNLEPNGYGKMVMNNGDLYSGGFKEGFFEGQGEYHYSNGDIYVGQFDKGREAGGELIRSDGSRYSAERNQNGTLYISGRADRSSSRENYLLEASTAWDQWFALENEMFLQSQQKDKDALKSEQEKYEQWKKDSGL